MIITSNVFYRMIINKENKFVIYISNTQINIMEKNPGCQWVVDGFWKVPSCWQQLIIFSIILSKESMLFPFCYVLADSKTEALYTEVIENVMMLLRKSIKHEQLTNLIVNVDFEIGLINAVQEIIKPSKLIGCFFHYTQCLWRKANEMGLRKKEKKLMTMQLILSCQFLCFVSFDRIFTIWNQIKENFSPLKFFGEFISYFEKNWLSEKIRFWNYSDIYGKENLKPQLHITNNYLESFNHLILLQNGMVNFFLNNFEYNLNFLEITSQFKGVPYFAGRSRKP